MSAEKRSVSAPEQLFARADARKEELGYSTFSDYIQALIRADVLSGGGHKRAPGALHDAPNSADLAELTAAQNQAVAEISTHYGKKQPAARGKSGAK